jgi:hypothetical protein
MRRRRDEYREKQENERKWVLKKEKDKRGARESAHYFVRAL